MFPAGYGEKGGRKGKVRAGDDARCAADEMQHAADAKRHPRMDRYEPALATRNWRLDGAKGDRDGQSDDCHAVLLETGQARISLRHGAINMQGPALIWLPVGEGRLLDIDAGGRGYFLSLPDDMIARSLNQYFQPGSGAPEHMALLKPQGAEKAMSPVTCRASESGQGDDDAGQAIANGEVAGASARSDSISMRKPRPGGDGAALRFMADTVHNIDLTRQTHDGEQARLIFALILGEIRVSGQGSSLIMGAQIIALLAMITRLADGWMTQGNAQAAGAATPSHGSVTLHRFLQVLEIHFREHWNVADYAHALGTSERRLALATVRATGKPPLQLIRDRVLHEACLRLEQSPLAVAQVAYGLGFRDPAYFNRFFKRYMAMAPGAWRRRKRAGLIQNDTSFAAWP